MKNRTFTLTALLVLASTTMAMEETDPHCMDHSEEDMTPTPVETCTGKGEKWLPCGEHKDCDPVCGKLDEPCLISHIVCPFGCQCPEGFAQIPNSRDCVPISQCDKYGDKKKNPKCKKNMVWDENATPCTDHCNRNLMDCRPEGKPRCVCNTKAGYSMTDQGKCVPGDKCVLYQD